MQLKITRSPRKGKRFRANFYLDNAILKYTDFGSRTGSTYIDHKDPIKRQNYINRHSKLNENWNNPFSAGALSRYILLEEKDLDKAIDNFKEMFGFN